MLNLCGSRCFVANLHADLSPVVVLVLKVVERRVVPATLRCVSGSGHACIPLADKVRGVSVRRAIVEN